LRGFQSLLSQNPLQSISIPSNPYRLKITEQALRSDLIRPIQITHYFFPLDIHSYMKSVLNDLCFGRARDCTRSLFHGLHHVCSASSARSQETRARKNRMATPRSKREETASECQKPVVTHAPRTRNLAVLPPGIHSGGLFFPQPACNCNTNH
jgi:hypothetical protein